ncbi:MAG TPA: hypothetical protein VGC66_01080 [Pyrinomonadaceae bacterium]|jgi:hypothetical protein
MLILRIIGFSLLVLGGLAVIVLLSMPFNFPQNIGIFIWRPERALWLLFLLGGAFGAILFALGSGWHSLERGLKAGGKLLLISGFVCALELFLIKARWPIGTRTISLWWLFVLFTLSGGVAVYITEMIEREELRSKEELVRKAELKARAASRAEQQRVRLRIVRVNVWHMPAIRMFVTAKKAPHKNPFNQTVL